MNIVCVLFLLSSPHRLSFLIVVFDFNASLNDVTPVSPILLPVDLVKKRKTELLMNAIYALFLFVFTPKTELSECCVYLQCITQ